MTRIGLVSDGTEDENGIYFFPYVELGQSGASEFLVFESALAGFVVLLDEN